MKRFIFLLILVLIVQIGYKFPSVFAQSDQDKLEIEKVVQRFYDGFAYRNIDAMMNEVSRDYHAEEDGNVIDYIKLRSSLENTFNNFFKTHTNYARIKLEIIQIDVQGDKASADLFNEWKAFNLEKLKEIVKVDGRRFNFKKENDSWKIVGKKKIDISRP